MRLVHAAAVGHPRKTEAGVHRVGLLPRDYARLPQPGPPHRGRVQRSGPHAGRTARRLHEVAAGERRGRDGLPRRLPVAL